MKGIVIEMNAPDLQAFHDAELLSIALEKTERKVRLGWLCADGSARTLEFVGVELFLATDLIQQNVLSRLKFTKTSALPIEQIAATVKWMGSLEDGSMVLTESATKTYCDRIHAGELLLTVMEPSWGAEVAIASREVILSTGRPPSP